MFNIAENTVIPNYGAALTEGLQTGQNMRVNALAMDSTRQKMEQEAALQPYEMSKAAGEVKKIALGNEEAQSKQIGAWANQVKDPASYARFRDMMKNVLGETEDGLLEDGLTPEYTPEVAGIINERIGVGQGVPERAKAPEPFTLGTNDIRYNADGTIQARGIRKIDEGDKPKPPPIDYAEKFGERLLLDVPEGELDKKDIVILRDATANKMRQGMDFEEAYVATLDELGLEQDEGIFNDTYSLKGKAPQEASNDLGNPPIQPNGKSYFVAPEEGEESVVLPNALDNSKEIEDIDKELERIRRLRGGSKREGS
jgi:hypothetical protein